MSYFISQGLLVYGFDVMDPLFIFLIPPLQHLQKQALVWKGIHSLFSLNLAAIISDQKSPEEFYTSPLCLLDILLEFLGCVYGKL